MAQEIMATRTPSTYRRILLTSAVVHRSFMRAGHRKEMGDGCRGEECQLAFSFSALCVMKEGRDYFGFILASNVRATSFDPLYECGMRLHPFSGGSFDLLEFTQAGLIRSFRLSVTAPAECRRSTSPLSSNKRWFLRSRVCDYWTLTFLSS